MCSTIGKKMGNTHSCFPGVLPRDKFIHTGTIEMAFSFIKSTFSDSDDFHCCRPLIWKWFSTPLLISDGGSRVDLDCRRFNDPGIKPG
jgi:hypothetical protein